MRYVDKSRSLGPCITPYLWVLMYGVGVRFPSKRGTVFAQVSPPLPSRRIGSSGFRGHDLLLEAPVERKHPASAAVRRPFFAPGPPSSSTAAARGDAFEGGRRSGRGHRRA